MILQHYSASFAGTYLDQDMCIHMLFINFNWIHQTQLPFLAVPRRYINNENKLYQANNDNLLPKSQ